MSAIETRQPTLLVVDNRSDRLSEWLSAGERVGAFRLVSATSYDSAVEALINNDVNVLVIDLFLTPRSEQSEDVKKAEGLEVIRKCVEMHSGARIVAITGMGGVGTEVGAAALNAGADDFICSAWRYVNARALLEQKLRLYARLLLRVSSNEHVST